MSESLNLAAQLRRVVDEENMPKLTIRDGANGPVADLGLREPDARMSFKITDMPASSMAVKIGRLGHINGLKDGGWKQICDYLLVIPIGDDWFTVLIEMKKTLSDENKAKEQLIRTIPVFEYLKSLCEIETQQSWRVVTHYVVIAERASVRLAKERIKVKSGAQPYRREEYRGIQIGFVVGDSLGAEALLSV